MLNFFVRILEFLGDQSAIIFFSRVCCLWSRQAKISVLLSSSSKILHALQVRFGARQLFLQTILQSFFLFVCLFQTLN